jgi:hypothetical protein
MIIGDFFPEDIFRKILDYNLFNYNAGQEWFTKKQLGVGSPLLYDRRKQINFHKTTEYEGPAEAREFWPNIHSTFLADEWFPKLVYEKFPLYFNLRFGEIVHRPNFLRLFERQVFLQRHEPGYSIAPHTDIPTRVFTGIMSFADRPGFEEFGTQICRPKDPFLRSAGKRHYWDHLDAFEVVKTAPYAPNSFLLFFKTNHSFHAVRTMTADVPNERYGMQFQFYEPAHGLFKYHDAASGTFKHKDAVPE